MPRAWGGFGGLLWLGFPPLAIRGIHPISMWDLGWIQESLTMSFRASLTP